MPARIRRFFFFAALFVSLLLLDQQIKAWVTHAFVVGESVRLPGRWLCLTYQVNTGAAFGIARGFSKALGVFSAVLIAVLLVYFVKTAGIAGRLAAVRSAALVLILAGAAGNAVDRLKMGGVVDYIDLGFWPVFNLADSAISVGAVILAIQVLFYAAKKEAV